jgi:hypothetical protein
MGKFVSGLPGPDVAAEKTMLQVLAEVRQSILLRRHRQKKDRSHANEARERAQQEAQARLRDEEVTAQDWYEEHQRNEQEWAAFRAAQERRDHLLPEEDQLPF